MLSIFFFLEHRSPDSVSKCPAKCWSGGYFQRICNGQSPLGMLLPALLSGWLYLVPLWVILKDLKWRPRWICHRSLRVNWNCSEPVVWLHRSPNMGAVIHRLIAVSLGLWSAALASIVYTNLNICWTEVHAYSTEGFYDVVILSCLSLHVPDASGCVSGC